MKNTIKLLVLLVAIGLFTACEDWLDVNTDPNNPTEITPDLVLPVAQYYTVQVLQDDRRMNSIGNLMMANWSQAKGYSWYWDEFKYLVNSSFYTRIFEYSYSRSLKQYQLLYELGEGYEYYQAIGAIMKAFHFQLLVDFYGDIPYTEALGRKYEATPVYDNAQVIYEDLITELTNAITSIKAADKSGQIIAPGDDDAMFGGDMDKWIQFANTLKIRILTRQSDMAGRSSYITSEIAVIDAEGSGFITGNVAIDPGWDAETPGKMNIFWEALCKDASGAYISSYKATCASDFVIDYLKTTLDPRIDYIYERPAGGHAGVPQGTLDQTDDYLPENVSNIGSGIFQSADQPAIIFTVAEDRLNRAELAVKALTSENAKTLYEAGVTASFMTLGLGAGDAIVYLSKAFNNVNWESSANKVEAIITQKWIATNGLTAEQAWFDYNRTGYPTGVPVPLNQSYTERPVRLAYPASEYTSNGDNVPTQPDVFSEKIFWAQ